MAQLRLRFLPTLALVALCSAGVAVVPGIAEAHGGPQGGAPGAGRLGHGPGAAPGNPNGAEPVGRATGAPDTDRGHSEGKGHTDVLKRAMPTVGRVASLHGSRLTLSLPNGTRKTFSVDARAFGQMRPARGESVAVESDDGMRASSIAPADRTIRGNLTAVSRDTVTLKLPNGRTQTIFVAPEAAARMNLSPGTPLTVISHDGGASATQIRVDRR